MGRGIGETAIAGSKTGPRLIGPSFLRLPLRCTRQSNRQHGQCLPCQAEIYNSNGMLSQKRATPDEGAQPSQLTSYIIEPTTCGWRATTMAQSWLTFLSVAPSAEPDGDGPTVAGGRWRADGNGRAQVARCRISVQTIDSIKSCLRNCRQVEQVSPRAPAAYCDETQ